MCGIAGILNGDGRPVDARELTLITRALAHRGPDGEGLYIEGHVGLGHRRLAILDLSSEGHQPMPCADGRYMVILNGEIFNFLEIRRELEALGHRFRSQSDTEVIGYAYHEWGADCVHRFNGMWAFAVWDSLRHELFLSRDHFGIKPLYYLAERDRFVFASELKSFLYLLEARPSADEEVMKRALSIPGTLEVVDETFLSGVKRLHAGHNMMVDSDGLRVIRWWETLEHLPFVPPSLEEQSEQFQELFYDACRIRLRSDVPVGTCLSGGLDSSSVICALAGIRDDDREGEHVRRTSDFQRAFVATYPGEPKDELRWAEQAIDYTGSQRRIAPVSSEFAVENLHKFAYDYEGFGGSPMIPPWHIYRELRRDGVTVSLDGHGGDEMLGGYQGYVFEELERTNPLRSPRRSLELMSMLKKLGSDGSDANVPGRLELLFAQLPRVQSVTRRLRGVGTESGSAQPLKWAWVGRTADESLHDYMGADELTAIARLDPMNQQLYREFHLTRLQNILRNFDRCSMAHGVEVRMPFMDWRLVCLGFALPSTSKIGGGVTKRVLREAMRGRMPESLRVRMDKVGFAPPTAQWFNGALGPWVIDQVDTQSFLGSTVWDGPAIREFVHQRAARGPWTSPDAERVWPFLHAHLWQEAFFEGAGQSVRMPATIV